MLQNLIIENLYGKTYRLNFNEDLTILYGLNGSGKTTILNIIYSILGGKIEQVCGYTFDYLEFTYLDKNKTKSLKIRKDKNYYEISLDDKQFLFTDIAENFDTVIKRRNLSDDFDESSDYYHTYRIDKKSHEYKWISVSDDNQIKQKLISSELSSLSEIVYIPLNRRVKGIDGTTNTMQRPRLATSNKKNIEDSLKVAESYFESYRNHIIRIENIINSQLRKEILNQLSNPMDQMDILKIISKDKKSFSEIEKDLQSFIDKDVYKNIKDLLKLYNKTIDSYIINDDQINILDVNNFMLHSFTFAQLSKLEKVAESAQSRKGYLDKQKKNLEYILDTINYLFEDTNKTLRYNHRNQKLFFGSINTEEKLDLSLLSSGEKQLVIFFIFSLIEFQRNQPKILLIDEPELSLHVEWQSKLLPLIMKNREKKQIIIATHSPDIIGDYIKNCLEVRGILN